MSGTASETSPSSSYSSSSPSGGMTIDIRPMIEDVSQVMTKHITSILTGVIGEYTIYKETHDTIMGLPCVRKLQDRIMELEQIGGSARDRGENIPRTSTASMNSREDEIVQLQSAIVDLNRYIHALESKVDMNAVASAGARGGNGNRQDEESVKLEIHENDEDQETEEDEGQDVPCVVSSTHKNVIITSDAIEEDSEEDEDEAEEEKSEADAEDTGTEAEAEEAEEEEADAEPEEAAADEAEEAEAEEEDAEAEEEDTEAEAEEEDTEADAEAEAEEEDTEADAEAEAEAEAEVEAEEAEIEVSEVKIKGKTYFTTDAQNGIIYACVDDDVGDEVGVFKNGVAVFNKGKK